MTHTIIAEKMVFGSDCIAKIEGKNVFIPYAVPGEKLEVEITKDFRDYSTARIVKILEPSPHRVEPFCPYYMKCGGCNMMHIDADYQKQLRKEILADAFTREKVTIPEIEVISGDEKGYRSRFQFTDGGLMEKQSSSVVPVECCPCGTAEINHYLSEVPFNERPAGRVHVFGSDRITSIPEGFDKIVIAQEEERIRKNAARNERRFTANGRLLPKQKKIKARFEGTTVKAENLCTVSVLGKSLTYDVQGFFQSNLQVLEKAVPHVMEGLGGKNALDMYSGCGTFSVFLSDLFEKVCLVEHNKSAIVYAEQNLASRKHESFGVSGEVFLKYHVENYVKANGPFDAVVVDPPRSGMEKSVSSYLASSGIPEIRSVSCNAATHARDAAILMKAGYKMTKLYLLDFYPQTCQIESLACFSLDK